MPKCPITFSARGCCDAPCRNRTCNPVFHPHRFLVCQSVLLPFINGRQHRPMYYARLRYGGLHFTRKGSPYFWLQWGPSCTRTNQSSGTHRRSRCRFLSRREPLIRLTRAFPQTFGCLLGLGAGIFLRCLEELAEYTAHPPERLELGLRHILANARSWPRYIPLFFPAVLARCRRTFSPFRTPLRS